MKRQAERGGSGNICKTANRLSECTLESHCRRRRGESVPHITLRAVERSFLPVVRLHSSSSFSGSAAFQAVSVGIVGRVSTPARFRSLLSTTCSRRGAAECESGAHLRPLKFVVCVFGCSSCSCPRIDHCRGIIVSGGGVSVMSIYVYRKHYEASYTRILTHALSAKHRHCGSRPGHI